MPVKDVFISYGRRESKAFVKRIYDRLEAAGYRVWLDIINIPPGDDFMQRIYNGIESAHNFIFVIAPHSLQSEFCRDEIEHALSLNKRLIPLLHVEPEENHPSWQLMHPVVRKTNWVMCRELVEEGIIQEEWQKLDDFEHAFAELVQTLEKHRPYVESHTRLLLRALEWDRMRKQTTFLLDGKDRHEAEEWLLADFKAPEQPPCLPTDLHAEYICESRKNAENMMTDVFISYAEGNETIRQEVGKSLARSGVTTWTHQRDIQSGQDYQGATKIAIEQADNFLFFISKASVEAPACLEELDYAISLNKRIIPLLVEDVPPIQFPSQIRGLSFVDFTNNVKNDDYDQDLGQILNILYEDRRYYQKHKILLTQALKWQRQQHNTSILLRGYNLQNAQIWFTRGSKRDRHRPTKLHDEFIKASAAHDGEMDIEVFVAYSRKDGDFARKLNAELEINGKTTWFDQDSIAEGVDFQEEIFKGIASADNFLFIISPDAVASTFCAEEVAYAANLGKRFIPVLYRPAEPSDIPEEVKRVQWISFESGIADFQAAFNQLMRALNIDREYVQQHKKWQQKAMDWEDKQRKTKKEKEADELLLGENELALAENWFANAVAHRKEPAPTPLQKTFLEKSRVVVEAARQKEKQIEETLRRRLRNVHYALMAGGVLLIAAIAAAVFAYNKSFEALEKEILAEENARQAKSLTLTYVAEEFLVEQENPEKALGFAMAAYDLVRQQPSTPLLKALRDVVNALSYINLKHEGSVNQAAFSPDGRYVVTCSDDKNAVLWQADGQLLATLTLHEDEVEGVAFSHDGERFVTYSRDQTAWVWTKEGAQVGLLAGHSDMINGAVFDPFYNNILTWSRDFTARLWRPNTAAGRYRPFKLLNQHTSPITHAAYSEGGDYIVTHSMSDANVHLWDKDGGHLLSLSSFWPNAGNFPFFRETDSTTQLLTVSKNGNALLYDADNGRMVEYNFSILNEKDTLVNGHRRRIESVALSPDGSLLLTRSAIEAKLWNMEGGLIADLDFGASDEPIDFALFSNHTQKDSLRILTAAANGKVRIWEYNGSMLAEATLQGHERPIGQMLFSPNAQQLLTTSADGVVRVWEINNTLRLKSDFKGHQLALNSVAFSPDGLRILTASDDYTAKLWTIDDNPFEGAFNQQAVMAWRRQTVIPELSPEDKVAYDLVEDMEWIRTEADTVHLRVYGAYFADRNRLHDAAEVFEMYLERQFSPHVYAALADVRYQQDGEFDFESFLQTDDSLSLAVYAQFFEQKADSLQSVKSFQKNDFFKRSEKIYQKLYEQTGSPEILLSWTKVKRKLDMSVDFNLFDGQSAENLAMLANFLTDEWADEPFEKRLPPFIKAAELHEKRLAINRETGNDVARSKRELAIVYNSIAYYHLFSKEYEKAWEAARRGKEIDPTYKWIDTKLAIACFYTDRYDRGMEILADNKGKSYGKDHFTKRYLEYFDKLEMEGVTHPDIQKARRYLQE